MSRNGNLHLLPGDYGNRLPGDYRQLSGKMREIVCRNGVTGNEITDTACWKEFGFSPKTMTTKSGFSQVTSLCFKRDGQTLEVNNFDFYRRLGNVFLWQVTSIDWDTKTVTVKRSHTETTWSLGGA